METVISGWSDFFVAAAGSAGALVGLTFVAISINLARIIDLPGVAGRAAETIILLSGTLAGSLVTLMPHLSSRELGITLLMTTISTWALSVAIQLRSIVTKTYYRVPQATLRVILFEIATLPGIWSSLALCGVLPGGIKAFAVGVILSMLVAMYNAWVLLVEIIR